MRFVRGLKVAFIEKLRNSGSVRGACAAVGVNRRVAYTHREKYPQFAAEWDEALEDAVDVLEATAWQRATTKDHPSDTLLIFLLKGLRPHKYRDNYIQTTDDGTLKELVTALKKSRRKSNAPE